MYDEKLEARYREAVFDMQHNFLYEKAALTFRSLNGYKDSAELAQKCQESINRTKKMGGPVELSYGSFSTTKSVQGEFYGKKKDIIGINDETKEWAIIIDSSIGKNIPPRVYKYEELISFELIEDGESKASGGIGRAIAGGILFGEAGAVVGAMTAGKKCRWISIRITVNRSSSPMEEIVLVDYSINKDSSLYREKTNIAREILSLLEYICKQNEIVKEESIIGQGAGPTADEIREFKELVKEILIAQYAKSKAEEIREYKQIYDEGIITWEEFEAKKKLLLGI